MKTKSTEFEGVKAKVYGILRGGGGSRYRCTELILHGGRVKNREKYSTKIANAPLRFHTKNTDMT